MKKVWMKPYACSLTLAAMFLGVPTLGRAQSMQQRIDHLNQCNDLMNKSTTLVADGQSVEEMIAYKKGTLTFDSEDLKSTMLRKVQALESENSVYDLDSLRKALLTRALGYVRKEEEECSDTDQNKSWRSQRLNQIGFLLTDLGRIDIYTLQPG